MFFISSSTKLNEAHRPYDLQSTIAWRWTCQWVSCLHASYWSLNHNLDFSDYYPVFRLFDICKHQFIKWDKSRRNTQVTKVIKKKMYSLTIYTHICQIPPPQKNNQESHGPHYSWNFIHCNIKLFKRYCKIRKTSYIYFKIW